MRSELRFYQIDDKPVILQLEEADWLKTDAFQFSKLDAQLLGGI